MTDVRERYAACLERLLAREDKAQAPSRAGGVLACEVRPAGMQWSAAQNRDRMASCARLALAELGALATGCRWDRWLKRSGIAAEAHAP